MLVRRLCDELDVLLIFDETQLHGGTHVSTCLWEEYPV